MIGKAATRLRLFLYGRKYENSSLCSQFKLCAYKSGSPLDCRGSGRKRSFFCEFNINQMASDVLRALLLQEGDVYAFSCYIWNIAYVLRLAEDIKKAEPEAVISWEARRFPFVSKV